MEPYAKVVADSVSPDGVRLTTMEVRFHRWVLAEMNTHRVFSRNSASSRAIPVRRQLEKIAEDPAEPLAWASEQKGMQGGINLEDEALDEAQRLWRGQREDTLHAVSGLLEQGLHKSLVNRLLEPHMGHVTVITSTAWQNFFHQRCSPLAQPEIRVAAEQMREAYEASTPVPQREGDWHVPYIDEETLSEIVQRYVSDEDYQAATRAMTAISAARCARVSYLTQDGTRDLEKDLELYERLTTADPPHWSPLEHVATPWPWNRQEGCIHFGQTVPVVHDDFTCMPLDHLPRVGNLLAWRSLRTTLEAEQGVRTYR